MSSYQPPEMSRKKRAAKGGGKMLGGLVMAGGAFFMTVALSTFIGKEKTFAFILTPMGVLDDEGEFTSSRYGKQIGIFTLAAAMFFIGGYLFNVAADY